MSFLALSKDPALKFYSLKICINCAKMDIVTIDQGLQLFINPWIGRTVFGTLHKFYRIQVVACKETFDV